MSSQEQHQLSVFTARKRSPENPFARCHEAKGQHHVQPSGFKRLHVSIRATQHGCCAREHPNGTKQTLQTLQTGSPITSSDLGTRQKPSPNLGHLFTAPAATKGLKRINFSAYQRIRRLRSRPPPRAPPRCPRGRWLRSCCWHPGGPGAAGSRDGSAAAGRRAAALARVLHARGDSPLLSHGEWGQILHRHPAALSPCTALPKTGPDAK